MRIKKFFCMVLAFVLVGSSVCINTRAVGNTQSETMNVVIARATGRFNIDVPRNTIRCANDSFPLDAGETVTIKASYTPFSASVDFGIITPSGRFRYVTATDDSIDQTITVNQHENYTFAIRNNSPVPISVSGYVNY